ncbi:uncharacterized protein BDW47DRAFT_117347 [Aspergillus candidus]|uniref:Epidermal growth factor receptor-like transmembrane-juxtamembrane segment domain-containing protein n=1 Tax=Aspergillus candidus TaxID=41067 RepID=A0A2I2FCG9_ASPCN|nr:hypothetical protein BDW47DRAFT_117347 [Aspergillus candidus]PLB38329.1 hypothetical protein BDW47DRAFT_117347 [Aspergillus candidus]
MEDSLDSPYGFALRRSGGCLDDEVDCGETWKPFHTCCPGRTFCPPNQKNVKCCPSNADCLQLIEGDPHCGNGTANMYDAKVDDEHGYFCCDPAEKGFMRPNSFVGCTADIGDLGASTSLMSIVSKGMTTPTPTPTPSSKPAPAPSATETSDLSGPEQSGLVTEGADQNTGTNVGAIAGGVVGGVAGLALIIALLWFLLRRRKQQQLQQQQPPSVNPVPRHELPASPRVEMAVDPSTAGFFGKRAPTELDPEPRARQLVHELPAGGSGGKDMPSYR